MKQLSIKKNMLWNSVGSLIYMVCQWLTTVLVVRLSSGYDAAGSLSLAMSISNVYAPIALYKMRQYQVSDIHNDVTAGEYVAFRMVTIGIGLSLSLLYMGTTCSPDSFFPILLYLLFRSVDIFIDVLHGIDQQNMRMDYCGKSMAARGLLILSAFSFVLYLSNSLEFAILAMIVSILPIMLIDIRNAAQFDNIKPHITLNRVIELLCQCFPAVVGTACCLEVTTLSRQILGLEFGEGILGIYASICTPIVVIQAGSNYIYAPLLGVFARYFDMRDIGKFRLLLFKVVAGMTSVFIVGTAGFSIFGSQLFETVFGTDILQYLPAMYPAMLCACLTALVSFFNDLLIALRIFRGCFFGNLLSLLLSIPLAYWLVARFQMNGASMAIAVSYCAAIAVMARALSRHLQSVANMR